MERELATRASRVTRAATVAVMTVVLGGCGGPAGASTAAGSQPAATPGPTATSSLRTPSPSPSQGPVDPLDFDVSGSIGGKQVAGKLSGGSFTGPCVGAPGQVLVVPWSGSASGTELEGEIDFKPGSWTIGSPTAQGTASLGLLGGKATDGLGATSGTLSTGSGGGSIDAMFTDGPGSIHRSGTWTCPAGAGSS